MSIHAGESSGCRGLGELGLEGYSQTPLFSLVGASMIGPVCWQKSLYVVPRESIVAVVVIVVIIVLPDVLGYCVSCHRVGSRGFLELPWSSDRVLGGLLLYLVPSCGLRAARWKPTITKFGYGPPPKPACDVEAWADEC